MKARGVGLALPLDRFTFTIDGDRVSVAFDPRAGDDESRWRFTLIDAAPSHLIAIGADTGGAAMSVRAWPVVPTGLLPPAMTFGGTDDPWVGRAQFFPALTRRRATIGADRTRAGSREV